MCCSPRYVLFVIQREQSLVHKRPGDAGKRPPLRELTIWSPAVFSVPTAEHEFRLGTRLVLTTGPS